VQLNGGNDAVNTLILPTGTYRDMRPSLGIDDDELVSLPGTSAYAVHPSLAPLMPLAEQGILCWVAGIGFEEPNRSHFVSMDRWWRAGDPSGAGWLGRALDIAEIEPAPLTAVAVGSGTPVLQGDRFGGTTVGRPEQFRFDGALDQHLGALAAPISDDPLTALAQRSFDRALLAVEQFAAITASNGDDDGDMPDRTDGANLADGLHLAAQLLAADEATRIVVVTVGGFDTHANQADVHARLLADLAGGIAAFWSEVTAAGIAEDVLLATTSEFGRRVAENGSGGCDHGAAGVSLVLGSRVAGGVHGAIDLDDLLDGDLRPVVDPLALQSMCLTWLGVDVERVLGAAVDPLAILTD
jgi:uncharacterized protein (DUF1501 family)